MMLHVNYVWNIIYASAVITLFWFACMHENTCNKTLKSDKTFPNNHLKSYCYQSEFGEDCSPMGACLESLEAYGVREIHHRGCIE